jgi:hypothetical protein
MTRLRRHTRGQALKRGGAIDLHPFASAHDQADRERHQRETELLRRPVPEGQVRCECGTVVRVRKNGQPFAHRVRGIPCAAAPGYIANPICDGCGESRNGCRCARPVRRRAGR